MDAVAVARFPRQSHPVWVRGLKQVQSLEYGMAHVSHPVWVRGLKLYVPHTYWLSSNVAPRVGAWIET